LWFSLPIAKLLATSRLLLITIGFGSNLDPVVVGIPFTGMLHDLVFTMNGTLLCVAGRLVSKRGSNDSKTETGRILETLYRRPVVATLKQPVDL